MKTINKCKTKPDKTDAKSCNKYPYNTVCYYHTCDDAYKFHTKWHNVVQTMSWYQSEHWDETYGRQMSYYIHLCYKQHPSKAKYVQQLHA